MFAVPNPKGWPGSFLILMPPIDSWLDRRAVVVDDRGPDSLVGLAPDPDRTILELAGDPEEALPVCRRAG